MSPFDSSSPAIGVAYSGYTPAFLQRHPDAVDYVEVPYELLQHDPSVIEISRVKPIVLHCASMSIASELRPERQTVDSIDHWIRETDTPWLGEHLSFIAADRVEAGPYADEYAPGEPYNIGYTVHPPLNESAIGTVLSSIAACQARFDVPLLLENPPLYFEVPGSEMSQAEFIGEITRRSSVELLLDLTHFYITARNTGTDPVCELASLPLDRVVEVHVSGVDEQQDTHWDNHSSQAPEIIFEMLEAAMPATSARAVTLEYNWSMRFPAELLLEELERTRQALQRGL